MHYYRDEAQSYARRGLFEYEPPPPQVPTSIEFPRPGTVVSGAVVLLASGEKNLHPRRVAFVLTGSSIVEKTLGDGTHTIYGWILHWKSSSVPNGAYQLTTEARGFLRQRRSQQPGRNRRQQFTRLTPLEQLSRRLSLDPASPRSDVPGAVLSHLFPLLPEHSAISSRMSREVVKKGLSNPYTSAAIQVTPW